MSSLARSFKPSSVLLSPRRRPRIPGRTMSNSSDLSLTTPTNVADHQADYFIDRPVSSAPNTPSPQVPTSSPAPRSGPDEGTQSTRASPESNTNSQRATKSNPIAIELPKLKQFRSGSSSTPPEPLSARGDLPGGYFPLHEDPKGRVHRTHPFSYETSHLQHKRASDLVNMQAEQARTSHSNLSAVLVNSSTTVSSYISPGFNDAPLPLGKYYPSNYEQQHPSSKSQPSEHEPTADTMPSSTKPNAQASQLKAESAWSEGPQIERRRKMQQYQRDMIAQASMGLGASANKAATPEMSLNGLPLRDGWLSLPSMHKPLSPRLHPLGSPGPVTPMELEFSASSHFDQRTNPSSPLAQGGLASPGAE